ncbi:MAG: pyruvate formate lyase-activating protein [Firmicutes bacterium]|jgi:pyruvate formate lyase activating enzyme|nr:pyruvate formate lyase-activating protein [Bacillota bacterium]
MYKKKGRLHSIETFGAVDGPGIRTVFFMQGCPARCLYCHNPDSWGNDGGRDIDIAEVVHWAERGKPYYGDKGGVTFSGGEPLLQGEFLIEAINALKEVGIGSAIDTSGTYVDQFTEEAVCASELILLDIKHPISERFEIITGRKQDTLFELIDIINRNGKHVWIRNVVVPDINDTKEDIKALNEFIKRVRYIDKVELLGYHTMAVDKYGKLGITYRLKGVPPMDGQKLNDLKKLVTTSSTTDAVSQVVIG